MHISIKNILTSNPILKIVSLMLGFFLWHILSTNKQITQRVTVPICVENKVDAVDITTPNEVVVTLAGPRAYMRTMDYENIALHLDAHELHEGNNFIAITAEKLFLPPSVKLINYDPLVIQTFVTKNNSKDSIACTT